MAPDPITPGRREGPRHCVATYDMATDETISIKERSLLFMLYLACRNPSYKTFFSSKL
jgi:hypothetical protein